MSSFDQLGVWQKVNSAMWIQCWGHYGAPPSDRDGSGCGWEGLATELATPHQTCPTCGGGFLICKADLYGVGRGLAALCT